MSKIEHVGKSKRKWIENILALLVSIGRGVKRRGNNTLNTGTSYIQRCSYIGVYFYLFKNILVNLKDKT